MKIVVYGLCLNRDIRKYWKDRLDGIKQNLKTKYQVDMKLFVDQDGSLSNEVQEIIGTETEVIDIRKCPTDEIKKLPRFKQGSNIGYKGMCLFYSSEFIHYLDGYDYGIRLDADSILQSPLEIDDFIESGRLYGYVRDKRDSHRETCETLPKAIKDYVRQNNISIKCEMSDINCWNFYNNFNISKLSFWSSDDYQNFMSFINEDGGIQRHRWGDSTIQANAVKMFCDKENIVKFKFAYEHRSHFFKNWEDVNENGKIKKVIVKS